MRRIMLRSPGGERSTEEDSKSQTLRATEFGITVAELTVTSSFEI